MEEEEDQMTKTQIPPDAEHLPHHSCSSHKEVSSTEPKPEAMPPYAGAIPPSSGFPRKRSTEPTVVTLNVGGQMFQTTPQTLALAGPKSLISSLSSSGDGVGVPFVDRDPDLFSVLLSLLRTGRLPSKADAFDLRDLVSEARFYGLDHLLVSSLSDAAHFDPFDLRRSAVLPLNGRDSPSAVATTPFGSVHVAHGSKITSFDWSLRRKSTVLTCFPAVDSLLPLSPTSAAAGATDFPGLHILDLREGSVKKALHWSAAAGSPGSTVQGIGASPDLLFGSFESCRRNASSIVAFDLAGGTLRPVAEIGRGEIYGAELDTAIPATKLRWVPGRSLLMAAGSHGGPSGLQGNIRLWDVRSGEGAAPVWELREASDCFADVTVSDSLSAMFKVGSNSGEVYMADLRKLGASGAGDPWVCLGDPRKAAGVGKKEGSGCRMESYGNQVFCSKGGDVEMWSEVVMASQRVMRRNQMGRAVDAATGKITHMGFGGTRMVLARKGQQAVEVWDSSSSFPSRI